MLDRNDIPFAHWQMKRNSDGTAVLGAIATEMDDLAQEIRQCILTPKRSVPLNPEKGCDLDAYRDRPMNIRQMFLAAEIREALERDVPRIVVRDIAVTTGFTEIGIKVTWSPAEMVMEEFIETEIQYVL
jgi:phage baseplate assembly protein W